MKKIIKYIITIIFIVISIGVYIILSFEQRVDDQSLINTFEEDNLSVQIQYSEGIRIWSADHNKQNVALFFIHGAPGSGDQFNFYLKDSLLRSVANVYSLDRPGYGFSDYGNAEPSIKKQAQLLYKSINAIVDSTDKIILISHSFGGPIAALMGINHPNRIKAHLMLNPVIDPVSEPMFWFSNLPMWWPFKYISSGAMKVATYEKVTHPEELNKHIDIWKENTVPTLMIQGEKDWLAPKENAAFVKHHFDKENTAVITLEEHSHFIPFNQPDIVVDKILKLIAK